jgi:hemoglobin/transferrin/lactoferrin receptor protein
MNSTSILMGLVVSCFTITTLKAQQDSIPNDIQLNEIVISYNKTEERKKNISQQIELIDAKAITRAQAQTTADLIAQNGSVLVQKSQQGGGSPVIRGFEASRILLVIDGVRMNNLIYRSGHLQNIMTVDNISLDRAEILFGPASTQYGTDALGGVIHLFTKKPMLSADGAPQTKVGIRTRYSTVNQESTSGIDVNLGWKTFASRTIVSYSIFGDLRAGSNPNPLASQDYIRRTNFIDSNFDKPGSYGIDSLISNDDSALQVKSGYKQYNVMQKFLIQQNEHVSHQLNLQYSNTGNVPRYDRLTDLSDDGLKWSEWYYGPQERTMLSYDLDIKNASGFFQTFRLNFNHQIIEESRYQRRYRQSGLQQRIENVTVTGANFFAQHKDERHELQVGADGQWNNLTSTASTKDIYTGEVSALNTRYPDGDNTMALAGLYASHLWKLTGKTNITDGIRVGYSSLHSSIIDTAFFRFPFSVIQQQTPTYSGNIGIVNNLSDKLKISGLVSSAFRVPNTDDLAKIFESQPGDLIVPNPNIKPEKSICYEIGVNAILANILRWDNTVYYTSFIDAIQTGPFTYNGSDSVLYDGSMSRVLAAQNSGKAYIYGFNSSIKTAPVRNIHASVSANYTYGRLKTDDGETPLDHISPLMARMSIIFDKDRFFAEGYALYNGQKKLADYSTSGEDNLNYATSDGMPAWYTLNLRAGYAFKQGFDFQFGMENILDTEYRVFASGISAPGRNFYGSLQFNF